MKSIIKIIKHQIYLLQFEDYNLNRFFSAIKKFSSENFFVPSGKKINWTIKLIFLLILSLLIILKLSLFTSLWFLVLILFIFVPLSLSTIIFYPIDLISKNILVFRAKLKLKKYRNQLKIIAITGSYGKTTTKEGIKTVLSEKFTVLSTEGNQNTLIGISKLILNKLNPNINIFVVEMAAYKEGNIKELCDFVGKPEIVLLTGINESHFERFKNIENTIKTKFEIVQNSKENALVILNSDDKNIINNFEKFIDNKKVKFYSSENNDLSEFKFINKTFISEKILLSFGILDNGNTRGIFSIPFLSEYIIGIAISSAIIAIELGMSWEEVNKGVEKFEPVEHRLKPIQAKNSILIIDDSYNGNPEGAKKAIQALSLFKERRRIYVTPGLAEVGDKNKELHIEIGKKLSKVADLVILEKNKAGLFIKEGLLQNGFLEKYIKIYNSIHDAHVDISNILIEGDVVLFQRGRSQFLFNWIDSMKK